VLTASYSLSITRPGTGTGPDPGTEPVDDELHPRLGPDDPPRAKVRQIESEPALEDGDLNFEKMSTAQLQEFVRERRSEPASADVLAPVETAQR